MDAVAEHIVRGRDFGIKAGELYLDEDHSFSGWQELLDFLNVDVCIILRCIMLYIRCSY